MKPRSAHQVLLDAPHGMPATLIAWLLDRPIESVYEDLVRLEGQGLVAVDVNSAGRPNRSATWRSRAFIGKETA